MSLQLIPRLNYKFTLRDAIYSTSSLFINRANDVVLKKQFKTNEIYYYNHARTALRIALSSLELKPNSGIGVMAFNCITVLNSINASGHSPVFIDVKNDFQIDEIDLLKKRDKIQAIVINHMFGIPNSIVKRIKEILPDIPVIEDCAHSMGTHIDSALTGSFGDFAVFSFGRAKFPSIGSGGFLLINNKKYLSSVKEHSNHLKKQSLTSEFKNIFTGLAMSFLHIPFLYKNFTLPLFKNMDNKNDFVGKYAQDEFTFYTGNKSLYLNKMKSLQLYIDRQRENGQNLKKSIPLKNITFQCDYNYFMLPILVEDRNLLIAHCVKRGVEIGTHFSKCIQWAIGFGYQMGDCKNAERLAEQIVTLPTHYNYSKKQNQKFNIVLNKYFT